MSDDSIFLVVELWLNPNSFEMLKKYRKNANEILDKYSPEYIYHGHAYEWVSDDNSEDLPTGIEIVKFKNEQIARKAISDLNTEEFKEMEIKIFSRVRCYLSRLAFPDWMIDEIGLQQGAS